MAEITTDVTPTPEDYENALWVAAEQCAAQQCAEYGEQYPEFTFTYEINRDTRQIVIKRNGRKAMTLTIPTYSNLGSVEFEVKQDLDVLHPTNAERHAARKAKKQGDDV